MNRLHSLKSRATVWASISPANLALGAILLGFIGLTVRAEEAENPVTLKAGEEWIPLKPALEIEAGSALDFSGMGFHDAPAGKHGWVLARPDGQFAFEKNPEIAQRFYGINLCLLNRRNG